MQAKQIEALAKAIGELQGQKDVDEKTRRIVAYAVKEAIRQSSTMSDKTTNGRLEKFRELAKTNTRPAVSNPEQHITKYRIEFPGHKVNPVTVETENYPLQDMLQATDDAVEKGLIEPNQIILVDIKPTGD